MRSTLLFKKKLIKSFGQSKRDHHILLVSTGYNGLTQRVHTELADKGHEVKFRLAISPDHIRESVNAVKPDFVICPFLQQKIPEDVCQKHLCLVFHPGIPGDGGPHAIDWAILNKEKEWGGILLQATEELDAGDIWASGTFPMTEKTKASVYRTDMTEVAVDCVNSFLAKYDSLAEKTPQNFATVTKKISDYTVQGQWRDPAKQNVRKIDWANDSNDDIIRKINGSDSAPGVAENFFGRKLFIYGAHREGLLTGVPGSIIAQREGAICIGTKDGAIWISHLREPKGGKIPFKLPAVQVLGRSVLAEHGVKESVVDPFNDHYGTLPTYRQVWYEEANGVGIVNFDFHNGAMSTEQCRLLRDIYKEAKTRSVKVLVLKGSKDFFSNGIHLNKIEAAPSPSKESWYNIKAINEIVLEILTNTHQMTVSAVEGNAGAGGVYLAIASDIVLASETSVLNPHYKAMGLYGSEYSTYTAPKRMGEGRAKFLRNQLLPVSASTAKKLNLIDEVIPKTADFDAAVMEKAVKLADTGDAFLTAKLGNFTRSKAEQHMMVCEATELRRMYDNFQSDVYHNARRNFVYKRAAVETPAHLKYNIVNPNTEFKTRGNILDGVMYAADLKANMTKLVQEIQKKDPTFQPGLAIVQVGNRGDSNVYVNKKVKMAKEIGIKALHLRLPEDTTEEQLAQAMEELNAESHIHGVMLQLPLQTPNSIDTSKILNLISPEKDVDAIGSTNLGKIMSGDMSGYQTCTPAACLELINKSGIMIQGKRVVVVGRSVVVGGTIAEMLKWQDATVTICHEHTDNIQAETSQADILVVAAGIPNYVKGSWIKPGAVVIDCGINPLPDVSKKSGMRIVGDVDYESAKARASYITPVPGGVGPMTVQMLMRNTVRAAAAEFFKASDVSAEENLTARS